MAVILKGAPVAAEIDKKTAEKAEMLKNSGIEPTLAILRVGEKPDDIYYENAAIKRCGKLGINATKITHSADVTQKELADCIAKINSDKNIHGLLMLRPLPKHIDESAICAMLNPEKDIDGITDASLAGVFTGSRVGYAPCTAQSCMEILSYYDIDPKGKNIFVLGRSLVIGRPVAMMLMEKNATVTIGHTKTVNTAELAKKADIIVAAAGRANIVDGSYLRDGQIVLDVGMNVDENGKMCGDVKFSDAESIVAGVTPVPGGVGSVTTSVLLSHVVQAAEKMK